MADAEPLIAVCPSAQLVDGGAGVRFEVVVGTEVLGAFVIRFRGQPRGYLNRCAHVAMELDWVAGQFFDRDGQTLLCSTHGAAYDPADGRCVGGACAGRGGLRRIELVEAAGIVYWRPDREVRAPPVGLPGR